MSSMLLLRFKKDHPTKSSLTEIEILLQEALLNEQSCNSGAERPSLLEIMLASGFDNAGAAELGEVVRARSSLGSARDLGGEAACLRQVLSRPRYRCYERELI